MFMPFQILGIWLRGLLTPLLIGVGIYLLKQWYDNRETVVRETVEVTRPGEPPPPEGGTVREERTRVVRWEFGLNRETAYLVGGLLLLGWSVGGGWLVYPRLFRRRGQDEPRAEKPAESRKVRLPDGTELNVEITGPADGEPVVLIHGWGLDADEWYYARRELAGRYRLYTWDLPGLGASGRPADRDWSLEKLARHLDAVVSLAGGRQVALVGHSIGGMIILTYCKLFPEALGTRVRSLVLAQTTYTNPVKTTAMAGLYTALQRPVLEPLCSLMVWLSPVVRVLNWLSYLNGSAHRSTERSSFSGNETRGQLDFITRYYVASPPDVVGRGMLAMFRYDATDTLARINVPTLIVAGDRDRTCVPEASRYMASAIPGARLVILDQARHCGLFEHHGRFHAAVAEFLAAGTPAAARPESRQGTPAVP
jgi:pimeloyl-ACP methyl ester carboxylesterase